MIKLQTASILKWLREYYNLYYFKLKVWEVIHTQRQKLSELRAPSTEVLKQRSQQCHNKEFGVVLLHPDQSSLVSIYDSWLLPSHVGLWEDPDSAYLVTSW